MHCPAPTRLRGRLAARVLGGLCELISRPYFLYPQKQTVLPQDTEVGSGGLGRGRVAGDPPTRQTKGNQHFLPLGLRPCLESSAPSHQPSLHPLLWGLLTQGSVQVLEDAAAVVQGDIDLLLQERRQQTAAGTGHGGQPALPPLPLPLPTSALPGHIRPAGNPGKASQWPSPWDLVA